MKKEIVRKKKIFNARVRELLEDGYFQSGKFENEHRFTKYLPGFKEVTVVLVQGWKSA